MIDLTNKADVALLEAAKADEYIWCERSNPDYLIALVYEEYFFTDEQLTILNNELDHTGVTIL